MRRRHFLSALLASASLPALSWADAGNPAFLAAAREENGGYALFGLDNGGADLFRIPLPGRGHAAAAHPTAPEAVAFARRPGTFALVIDCVSGGVLHRLDAPEGRHFYGHGAFLEGGNLLVTTENDIDSGQGVLGLWARDAGYRRIGEIASGGIGPHELLRLPGDVIAVANGGILTHPDRGRDKLNLDTMRPNLSYVTVANGIEEVVELDAELHHASIRHLAYADGQVGFAMQWQGDLPDPAPLLGLHRKGGHPVLCSADLAEQMAMDGYAGSIAMAGGRVAITSPRGGRVHLFDTAGEFLQAVPRRDVCGVASAGAGFVVTDGLGGVLALDEGLSPLVSAPRAWDNHLVRLGG
ncbi:hypothetical protein SAMN04488093_101486 [Tropicibacter naphthalenivorans]|uniref:Twin-arginine translocation pathway signal n=2 Tax=Tropicibacter naphthalenivorans TaxID=441103 RepID=A0A0P1GKW7_9RHOB|nr:hypothetical protein TRN7648_00393 [Tropicibacter naphthalenivorans]SMC44952.1 hypothetical protein SAMN04488093_101486 [Tropicibacter naphthalenivorans]